MLLFMKKISLLLTFLFLLFYFAFPIPTYAKSIQVHSYLITEEQEFKGTPLLNTVIFEKLLNMGYRSGKVVLSSTPDGKGRIYVPDDIVISASYPGAESFRFSPGCPAVHRPTLDISHVVWKSRKIGYSNLSFAFTYRNCRSFINEEGVTKDYAKIGPLYVVHFDDYDPGAPTPFLELPWDYKAKGLSFGDAALAMSSYFDHEYPLLSTNLNEVTDATTSVISFLKNVRTKINYSSHDGYDWAYKAGARLGEPVLAATGGTATYVKTCGACGNAIHIDHGNGYQTRYYHLLDEGLITNDVSKKISVTEGQQIGQVGYTGNVIPQGTDGAHIHFMVIHDKNGDGNFDDNIPDGIVDPFGWQSDEADPWEAYSFNYMGETRTGTKSNYLWKNEIPTLKGTVTANGGSFAVDRATITIPKNTISQDAVITMQTLQPKESDSKSFIRGVQITISDGLGNIITSFQKAFDVVFNFALNDIARYKPETVSIYSTSDGTTWQKENTTIDTTKGEIKTNVNHLTDFAIMGEKIDNIAPETLATVIGTKSQDTTYITPVKIYLTTSDKPVIDSLGVAYTLYAINNGEQHEYKAPIEVKDQGTYDISYYSIDGDNNIESIKHIAFNIENVHQNPTIAPQPTSLPTIEISPTKIPTATVTMTPTRMPTATINPTNTPTKTLTPSPTKAVPTKAPTKTPTPTPTPKSQKPIYTIPAICILYKNEHLCSAAKKIMPKKEFEQLKKLCEDHKYK
ncbi:hypothetical protein BH09PAT2_BH09PAT2_02430 [soil metagenome]